MKYVVDHDYHIHSFLSPCSHDPEQTSERILQYGIESGYKHICLTNHLWDSAIKGSYGDPPNQTYDYISQAFPLPQSEDVAFHKGCETDMDINYVLGIGKEVFDKLEFVIISTTHLQLAGYTIRENATLEERAEVYIKRLEKVLDCGLDFHKIGIAHPVTGHASPENPFNELYALLDKDRIREVFTELARKGAGVEINSKDWNLSGKSPEHIKAILDFYDIIGECGCKFYLGGDTHRSYDFVNNKAVFENAVDVLKLTENEKFRMW